jgi:hypothetical protein
MAKKKNSIPKRVAGVKVPKFLRKSSLMKAMLATPMGRDIAAQALVAAAGAAAAVLVRDREQVAEAGEKGVKKSMKAVDVATEAVQSAANAVVDVVSDAAKTLLPEHASKSGKSHAGGRKEAVRH